MPTYTFRRPKDGALSKRKLTFAEYDLVKSGDFRVVDEEGNVLDMVLDPGGVNFILKDGPSGGWTSKANKENKYRRYRQDVMTRRERDHVFKTRLIPNYQGQEAPSWREAQEEARSRDGDLAASTYEPHVSKESAAQ